MNVLVTSAGRRVSLVKAFKHELSALLPASKVFTCDVNPKFCSAGYASDYCFEVPRLDHQDYISFLLNLCIENNIQLVIPTLDTELKTLAINKAKFKNHGINIVISEIGFIEICRNKFNTNEFFKKNNVKIPQQYEKTNIKFPLFIKPYDGSLSKDIFIITDASELNNYHLTNEKLMFMELVDNKLYDEYTVDMYYDKNGNLKCLIPRKRIEIRGGEISKGITCKNFIINYLLERLEHIENVSGCITMQLFYNSNNDDIYGIEINPRFGGGFPLSYEAGGNFPKWIIEEYLLDQKIDFLYKLDR